MREVIPLGDFHRIRVSPCGHESPLTLELSVRPEESMQVGNRVNLEIETGTISVFNALGERVSA